VLSWPAWTSIDDGFGMMRMSKAKHQAVIVGGGGGVRAVAEAALAGCSLAVGDLLKHSKQVACSLCSAKVSCFQVLQMHLGAMEACRRHVQGSLV
jgi:carbohydrate-binding DOMON domain-containing protein